MKHKWFIASNIFSILAGFFFLLSYFIDNTNVLYCISGILFLIGGTLGLHISIKALKTTKSNSNKS
ncbi:hypothetical protein CLHOM_25770 [Clostridium homopropionicum DSM 5847]|uniref:YrhK domain-containing protein n=1 Tax=Clostridium homopropionicum DSM 5847 TaxID=1121318 RepID=A0A0L6Z7Y9_9CLOT|nr:hypothetical protein [Clostridium homopropionicum]KOA19074.1 hypothetical protein CLHOM_25770 [Clostridium homopropionicum DSM 5847]SFG97260.1 hypothetical protein SAMN04488501_12910 [Clostridium homopropionicum]